MLSPLARQIAALGLALCAVALSLAYPLRNYLGQQGAERAAVAEQHQLEDQIADLEAQQAALQDPAYIKAEAKRRLQYVSPGDTVYVVKVPAPASTATPAPNDAGAGSSGPAGTDGHGADGTGGDATASSDGVTSGAGSANAEPSAAPWYASLWDTLSGADDDSPAAPTR